ncbi:unnamed protein product, partial [Pocillopora meandrina]
MTKVSGPSNIFFDQRTVKELSSETLLRLAELVLTLNCFSFGGNHYKQTNGVAMGTKMGPSYANLFVVFTTKLQIHIVTCCIHPHILPTSFQTNDQSGTFKCARSRCKTCPFIHNVEKISGPKRSIKIIDHFACTSANVIYCKTCTYCNKLYIGETGRRLGDRFREHLRDVERNDKDASKPVARHF